MRRRDYRTDPHQSRGLGQGNAQRAFLGKLGRGELVEAARDADRGPGRQLIDYQTAAGELVARRFHALPLAGDVVELGLVPYRVLSVRPGSIRDRRVTVAEVEPEVCAGDR